MKRFVITLFAACAAFCTFAAGEVTDFIPPEFKYTPGEADIEYKDGNGESWFRHGTYDTGKNVWNWENNFVDQNGMIPDPNDPNYGKWLNELEEQEATLLDLLTKFAQTQANLDALANSLNSLNDKVDSLHGQAGEESGDRAVAEVENATEEGDGTSCKCEKRLKEIEDCILESDDRITAQGNAITMLEQKVDSGFELNDYKHQQNAITFGQIFLALGEHGYNNAYLTNSMAAVAWSGDYNDLTNAPATSDYNTDYEVINGLALDNEGWLIESISKITVTNGLTTVIEEVESVSNKFAKVAKTGDYRDLVNLPSYDGTTSMIKPVESLYLNGEGLLTVNHSNIIVTNGLVKVMGEADIGPNVQFAKVAKTGDYNDLSNPPPGVTTIFEHGARLQGSSLKIDTCTTVYTNGICKKLTPTTLSVDLSTLAGNVTTEIIEDALQDIDIGCNCEFCNGGFTNAVHSVEQDPVWQNDKPNYVDMTMFQALVADVVEASSAANYAMEESNTAMALANANFNSIAELLTQIHELEDRIAALEEGGH